MQSRHFMQPGSTTMPYSRTSRDTLTFDVHEAVQCPQPSHASVTRMESGATWSATPKMPPYGQPYVQNPLDPSTHTITNPTTRNVAIASGHEFGNVRHRCSVVKCVPVTPSGLPASARSASG